MPRRENGFTLIELLIVIAILGIIASIAIPRLMAARITSNESAVVSTLRSIASAQAQFQSTARLDVNGNGTGEFGFFGELSAGSGLRNDESGGVGSEHVNPPALSTAFTLVQNGAVIRSGYYFRIFLPAVNGSAQAESANGGASGVSISSDLTESLWCCYAWPVGRGASGNRAYFVNQSGDVLSCRNVVNRYTALTSNPAGTAAMHFSVSGPVMGSSVAVNATGQDGEFWMTVN